ncbi:hypothetical protein TNIN_229811 [Trichonephila inaurata madagascariensis]|uniref:Uncharacterized protein n=1 Tax=Trichonephila inaurata madagascariensis TaxID=2747483 RepID=A0A8X6YS17_9ARAC|nr:hypothetical protein TNIN_229811 [Trichonephila inaurata madagascariensis]
MDLLLLPFLSKTGNAVVDHFLLLVFLLLESLCSSDVGELILDTLSFFWLKVVLLVVSSSSLVVGTPPLW